MANVYDIDGMFISNIYIAFQLIVLKSSSIHANQFSFSFCQCHIMMANLLLPSYLDGVLVENKARSPAAEPMDKT